MDYKARVATSVHAIEHMKLVPKRGNPRFQNSIVGVEHQSAQWKISTLTLNAV